MERKGTSLDKLSWKVLKESFELSPKNEKEIIMETAGKRTPSRENDKEFGTLRPGRLKGRRLMKRLMWAEAQARAGLWVRNPKCILNAKDITACIRQEITTIWFVKNGLY